MSDMRSFFNEVRVEQESVAACADAMSDGLDRLMRKVDILVGEARQQAQRGPGRPSAAGRAGTARRGSEMTRIGMTPAAMLSSAQSMFGRRGFTVNEYIARSHREKTSTNVEGARQLLQTLVTSGVVGRGSRCDAGYRTEVEYAVLDAPPPGRPAGALLASIRHDVRSEIDRAVDLGWQPSSPGTGRLIWFTDPADDSRRFIVVADPKTPGWRRELSARMRRVGAPTAEEAACTS